MFFYIYKITNIKNQKYYIGKHSSKVLIDLKYYGSGKLILKAIKKHGKEYFKKEIVCYCETELELNAKEREIVCESIVKDSNCYNIKIGGIGGLPLGTKRSQTTKDAISKANSGKVFSLEHKKRLSESHKGHKRSKASIEKQRSSLQRSYSFIHPTNGTIKGTLDEIILTYPTLRKDSLRMVARGIYKQHQQWTSNADAIDL